MTNTGISGAGPARLAADAPRLDALVTATVIHVGRAAVVLRTSGGALVPVTSATHGLVPGGVCLGAGIGGLGLTSRGAVGASLEPGPWRALVRAAPRVDLGVAKGAVDPVAALALLAGALAASADGGGRGAMDAGPTRRAARVLVAAAGAADPGGVRAVLHRLVGVGPGSTPSGDDVVVGVLAGLDRRCDATAERAGAAIRHVLPALLHRTTSLSRHALAAVLRGQVAERVHLLLAATTEPGTVGAALRAARTWGATSGLDLAAGVAAGAVGVAVAGPVSRPVDALRVGA